MKMRNLRPLGIPLILATIVLPLIPRIAFAQPLVARYPYIQSTTTTSTIIAWKTDVQSDSTVEYGLTSNYGLSVSDATLLTAHALSLTGLSPNTFYHYRVKGGGAVLTSDEVFKTAPGQVNPAFSFVAFGDSGTGGPHMFGIANLVKSLNPDLLIHTGDLIYNSGEAGNFDPNFFTPYRDVIKSKPFFGVMGNHDEMTNNGQPWLDAFYLPSNNPLGTERFYSFDYGNAHFIALEVIGDTALSSAQLNWLINDLQNTTQLWKFVYFHVPPYSSSLHGSALNVKASVSSVLEQYGVDMVFNGHDHDYERSVAVKDFFPGNKGVVYVVTGGGGDQLYASGTSSFTAYSESAHHVTYIQINGSVLTLRAVREDGTVMDSTIIDRSVVPPTINGANTTAIPNMVSLFGDNGSQSRNSPFGPSWTRIVVTATGTTGVTARLGDFITAIMPADSRSRALSATAWDSMIANFNATPLSNTGLPAGVYATAATGLNSVTMESILGQVLPQFSTADARKIVEQELRTGPQTISVVAINGAGTTTSTVTVWVVDAQVMLHKGWNLRSTPMALADSTWGSILALGNKTSIIGAALKYNAQTGVWQLLGASDTVSSLDSVYIYSSQDDSIGSRLFRSTTGAVAPASKNLYRGAWNLVGTAPDFTENFATVTASNMRGTLPITAALASLSNAWVTVISPGEADNSMAQTYTSAGVTLGTYTWRSGAPGWSFTNGTDTTVAYGVSTKGWTVPFSGYWVFIQTDPGGLTTPVVLSGKNQGVLNDAWLLQLLTLGP